MGFSQGGTWISRDTGLVQGNCIETECVEHSIWGKTRIYIWIRLHKMEYHFSMIPVKVEGKNYRRGNQHTRKRQNERIVHQKSTSENVPIFLELRKCQKIKPMILQNMVLKEMNWDFSCKACSNVQIMFFKLFFSALTKSSLKRSCTSLFLDITFQSTMNVGQRVETLDFFIKAQKQEIQKGKKRKGKKEKDYIYLYMNNTKRKKFHFKTALQQ